MGSRPKYESSADRSNQYSVLAKLEHAFGVPAEHPTEEIDRRTGATGCDTTLWSITVDESCLC